MNIYLIGIINSTNIIIQRMLFIELEDWSLLEYIAMYNKYYCSKIGIY